MYRTIPKKGISCIVAFALAFSLLSTCLAQTKPAYAETTQTEAELTEVQRQVEQSAKDYDEALARVESLDAEIAENELKIDEIEKTLPYQREKSNNATIALYKLQQDSPSLITMILSAGSIMELIDSVEYINRIQQVNVDEIHRLSSLLEEYEAIKESLSSSKAEADERKNNAEKALQIVQEKREELQRRAIEEAKAQEEAARAAAEAEAAAQAQAQAEADAAANSEPANTGAGITGGGPSPIDWSTDKATFVDEWTVRIDNYLAGSPLSGQGHSFAVAAWDYGVDPRWSPAISNTESSKGLYCFRSHNAWGWGQIDWNSWEEAIDTHVRGLARGYGYTISVASAKKYCPPNWEHWYNSTLAQMNSI